MRGPQFQMERAKPQQLGPEYNPWFWNPGMVSVRFAPDHFMAKLKEIDVDLSCTWNPITERWQIWNRKPSLQHPICRGWVLLFHVHGSELDERVFARLYGASAVHWGSARKYFDAIAREMERDREMASKAGLQDTIDQAMEVFDHSQIKNIGKGNKFSTYHQ